MNRTGISAGVWLLMMFSGVTWGQAAARTPDTLTGPGVVAAEKMPVRRMGNGGESRDAVRGVLPGAEHVAAHESVLPAGVPPNPAHAIEHTELILVREGMVEFEHDGTAERAVAGDVIVVTMGTKHAIRNVGAVPAKYFVVQVGGDTK